MFVGLRVGDFSVGVAYGWLFALFWVGGCGLIVVCFGLLGGLVVNSVVLILYLN